VTLVEMLVSVALLVLMMTVLVTIFSSATGAVSGLQAYQELDANLRQLDITIRQDLLGVTAKMTPPLDPAGNLGYFEYGENAYADLQGEDTDDYVRFTAKAPEGQLFTGRVWLNPNTISPGAAFPQPVLVSSQYAEIIYFLRNGNLYRRVLLIAPDRQASVDNVFKSTFGSYGPPYTASDVFVPNLLSSPVSWQGVNDLSARPTESGLPGSLLTSGTLRQSTIVLNTLGDLTNRQNRAFYQRFANDYVQNVPNAALTGPDGIPDDMNGGTGDGIPDYYPTLYTAVFANANPLIFETSSPPRIATVESMAFPYVFPGAYSQPDTTAGALTGSGWIHTPDPSLSTVAIAGLRNLNHAPVPAEAGVDSLPDPTGTQTWWGFPTWRETLSPNWTDPYQPLSTGGIAVGGNTSGAAGLQPNGLHTFLAGAVPTGGATPLGSNFLPPMTINYRLKPQDYNDGAGLSLFAGNGSTTLGSNPVWTYGWDDDLLMTNVRSFDVKAYDNTFPGYVDLGWGDDLRLYSGAAQSAPPPFLTGIPTLTPPLFTWLGTTYTNPMVLNQTLAHEGRMPPLVTDHRLDAQFPNPFYPTPQYSSFTGYTSNVGDNNTAVVRLRRVWDSWSTDYTQAPATGLDPITKLPLGPPWSPPVLPSYPPPYPAPLRGIQIQIRVNDTRNQRVKTLTIRQDFSDKL
jgi:hypothetical protein